MTILNPYDMNQYDQEINDLYASRLSTIKQSLERLDYISRYFLGRPYLNGALGEGLDAVFDQSPLYRTDFFDCLTYVNTVLALFYADNLSSFQKKIVQLNYYDNTIAYEKRFHFMDVDWNPINAAHGDVNDITRNIKDKNGHSITEIANAYIDRPNWLRHRSIEDLKFLKVMSKEEIDSRLKQLHLLADTMQGEASHLDYIPLTQLFDVNGAPIDFIWDQIPDGSIIEIVRPMWDLRDKIGTCINVSHLGFVFRQKQEFIFRQASLLLGKIVDVSLRDYLHNYLSHATIKGINIQIFL